MSSGLWDRRNVMDPFYYDVKKCNRKNPEDPGDCDECGGPCIRTTDLEDVIYNKVINESCMFCGMEFIKWER